MTPEEIQELRELVEFLRNNNIGEFDLERGDLKVRIKFVQEVQASASSALELARLGQLLAGAPGHAPAPGSVAMPPLPSPAQAPSPIGAAVNEDEGLHIVKSPMVGTFYESSSPGSPPFVKPGDTVEAGQVLCIVEAMKLMNEIESDAAGEVVKRFVTNGQPVEYGQQLFALRPR